MSAGTGAATPGFLPRVAAFRTVDGFEKRRTMFQERLRAEYGALDGYRLLVAGPSMRAAAIAAALRARDGEIVGPARDAEEALRLASREPIDCALILDGMAGDARSLRALLDSERVPMLVVGHHGGAFAWSGDVSLLVDRVLAALGETVIAPAGATVQISPASGLEGSA